MTLPNLYTYTDMFNFVERPWYGLPPSLCRYLKTSKIWFKNFSANVAFSCFRFAKMNCGGSVFIFPIFLGGLLTFIFSESSLQIPSLANMHIMLAYSLYFATGWIFANNLLNSFDFVRDSSVFQFSWPYRSRPMKSKYSNIFCFKLKNSVCLYQKYYLIFLAYYRIHNMRFTDIPYLDTWSDKRKNKECLSI